MANHKPQIAKGAIMYAKLKFLLLYYLSWLVFFEGLRLVFVLYHLPRTDGIPFGSMLGSFWYGLRMDLSVAAYILAPVCLFVILSLFIRFFQRLPVYRIYTLLVLLIVCLISLADLEVYNAWGFRMDAGPLRFLQTPREAMASVSHLPLLWIALLFLLAYGLFYFCFRWLMRRIFFQQQNRQKLLTGFVLLLVAGSLILPIRGGWQLAPLNQSAVYFSQYQFANHAAINASWNFLHSLFSKSNIKKNPYRYWPDETAKIIVDSLYRAGGKQEQWVIASDSSPINVILVIWESFTAKAVGQQHAGVEITPRFNQLTREGIYFDRLYASGDRTNKGVPAILSGYPAMPNTTIIHNPAKSARLKTLPGELDSSGYTSAFYYGGEPEFANIKSYLVHAGFEKIVGKEDFSDRDMNSKWGAHDGVVMQRLFSDLSKAKSPFFYTWLTLSSHEPFETPEEPVIKGKDHTAQFLNSIHYTDKVFGQFVDSCRKQPWWDRTLLIVVGDHGHPLPRTGQRADDFHTPMLWLGGALSRQPFTISHAASQLDLASTLLLQLKPGSPSPFPFSKNLADSSTRHWAFFNFNDGFGWVDDGGRIVYDNIGKRMISSEGQPERYAERAGKAMQQFSFQDFIEK